MSNDAVEYVYLNVGFSATNKPEAVEYVYLNVGSFGVRAVLGRVVGITHRRRHAVPYVYINVLEQVSGSARTMEDGQPRHLEDGTTERTLE